MTDTNQLPPLPPLQPAQATQAEVTLLTNMLESAQKEAQRLQKEVDRLQSRAAVPMTEDQRQSAFLASPTSSGGHRTAFMLGVRAAEAHHFGTTAQAKKEGV